MVGRRVPRSGVEAIACGLDAFGIPQKSGIDWLSNESTLGIIQYGPNTLQPGITREASFHIERAERRGPIASQR